MGNIQNVKTVYSINDHVTYRKAGICRISDIADCNFAGQGKKPYYVLVSVYDENTKVFVPVGSELEKEMQKMLTVQQINDIIDESRAVEFPWIENFRERAAFFEKNITEGDRVKMLCAIRILSELKQKNDEQKQKNKAYDLKYLALTENMIACDFAYALGIKKNEVMDYIKNRLANN